MGLRAWFRRRAQLKRDIKREHAELFEGSGDNPARPRTIGWKRAAQKAHLERIEVADNKFSDVDSGLLRVFRASGVGNPIISHPSLFRYTPNTQPTLFHAIAEQIGRRNRMAEGRGPNLSSDRYFMKDRDVLGYKPGGGLPTKIGEVTCAVQGTSLMIEYRPLEKPMQHGLIPYTPELLQKIEEWMVADTNYSNERYNYTQKYGNK